MLAVPGEVFTQTTATGRITGQVTDTTGGVLPGVRVTVAGNGFRGEAITDEAGRFEVEGLLQPPPASYAVTAELAGFTTRTINKVAADPGSEVGIVIELEVGCLHEVLYVDLGVEETLKLADGVFLVRIESSMPSRRTLRPHCGVPTEYAATVIETVKDSRGVAPATIRIVYGDRRHRLEIGTDYLVFLTWEPRVMSYQVIMPSYVIPVPTGVVQACQHPEWIPCGPVSEALAALRSLVSKQ